jgi:hypothetical protein
VKSGPLQGVPISGCLGDQMAALLGQRCRPQEAKATYGTGCFVLMHTGCQPVTSEHRLLTTVAYKLGPSAKTQYALEGKPPRDPYLWIFNSFLRGPPDQSSRSILPNNSPDHSSR